jgi:hypothetical protein
MKQIDPQAAMEQLWKLAPLHARAKAERIYLEEYRKTLKATLMQTCGGGSMAQQERDAYAHEDYIKHLAGLRAAVETEEALRWRMVAAQTAVDVWRSQNASNRAIDRAAQ